jgi:uncharacterized membrane protein
MEPDKSANFDDDILVPIIEDPAIETQEKTRIIQKVESEYFSGPLPSPAIMKQYEEILPGSAERILKMAEKQSDHRMALESAIIPKQQKESSRGQLFAFVLSLALIGGGIWAIIKDCAWIAGVIFSVTIISVTTLLISGRGNIKKDISTKKGNAVPNE